MKSIPILLALAVLPITVLAAPPDGDPPAQSAVANAGHPPLGNQLGMSMMQHLAAQLPQKGTVLSTINAGAYTYIEVKQGEQTQWLAAQTVAVKMGDVIRFDDGALMDDFHSKSLNRTFPHILFVSLVAVNIDR